MPPLRLAAVAREPTLGFAAPVRKNTGFSSTPGLFYGLGLSPSNTGMPITPYTAVGVSAVYACVKRISEDIAKLPLVVKRRQSRGYAVDTDHALNGLFRRPNRWQTHSQAWQFVIATLAMRGNGIAAVFRGAAGEPEALVPIPFDRVSVMQGSTSGDLYYQFSTPFYPGKIFKFHQDNIVHARTGTFDGIMGVPPIYQSPDVFGLALGAQTHGSVLFRQGAQLNGFLKHPNTLSKEAKEYISHSFDMRNAGVQNAHKTLVLEEGMAFDKVQMTNEDAQFLECVTADTVITMADGQRKRADAICVGDVLMSWADRLVPAQVLHVGKPPPKQLVRVTTTRGRSIVVSKDHPFLAHAALRTAGGRPNAGPPTWTAANDLVAGSFIRVALGSIAGEVCGDVCKTAWFLGVVAGNGYVRRGGCSLSFGDASVPAAASAYLETIGGGLRCKSDGGTDYEIKTGGVGRRGSQTRDLLKASEMIGAGASGKCVPPLVFAGGAPAWRGFLSGYLDTDGTVAIATAKQPTVSWSSISHDLLEGCQHLLALLGIQSGIYPISSGGRRLVCGQVCDTAPSWQLIVCGRAMLRRLAWLLIPEHVEKAARLHGYRELGESRYRPENFEFDRVTSILDLGVGETVGIEVKETHTHVTNGFVTHNTRKFSVIEVCRLYSMPPHKIGALENAHFDNVENGEQQYINDCLHPVAQQVEETLENVLLFDDERETHKISMDFKALLRGDRKTRAAVYHSGVSDGWMTRNEARAEEDLEVTDPKLDEFVLPLNMGNAQAQGAAADPGSQDAPVDQDTE